LQTSNLILDFEFDQYLESHKHVINIIMGFRDMGCYTLASYRVHWSMGYMPGEKGMTDCW
jgi:hypothetical protein